METTYYVASLDTDRPVESLTRALDTAQMHVNGQYRKIGGGGGGAGAGGADAGGTGGRTATANGQADEHLLDCYIPSLVAPDKVYSAGNVSKKSEFFEKRKITEGRTYVVAPPTAPAKTVAAGSSVPVTLVAVAATAAAGSGSSSVSTASSVYSASSVSTASAVSSASSVSSAAVSSTTVLTVADPVAEVTQAAGRVSDGDDGATDEAAAEAAALRYRHSFDEAAARFERLASASGSNDRAASSTTFRADSTASVSLTNGSSLRNGDAQLATVEELPPSFVPASDESTAALWKAVDAFKQATTIGRGVGAGRVESGLCGDQLVLGYFSDTATSVGGSRAAAAGAATIGKRRSDGAGPPERVSGDASVRRATTMRATHSSSAASSSFSSSVEARTESSTIVRRSRTETALAAIAAADGEQQSVTTVKSSSGSSGSSGRNSGGIRVDIEGRERQSSPNGTPPPQQQSGGRANGDRGADQAFLRRRNGGQYASFRQIRPPSAAPEGKKSSTMRHSTTTTTVTTNVNIYQLSLMPLYGGTTKEIAEPGYCAALKNYTKGRPFVTYWVKLVIRDIKFDNASNLLISTKSCIVMFDVNGYLLGEVFRDVIGEPYGLFVCENNDILVADCKRNAVVELDVMGRVVKTYGPVAAPAGVAMARDGRVYACSRWNRQPPCVVVFSPEGEILGRVGDEYLDNPVSLALHGTLTIVCDGHYTVGIDRRGQVQFVYGQEPSTTSADSPPPVACVAVDVEGYVLVTDFSRNSLCGMTPDVDQAGIVLGEANECRHPCFVATSRFGHLAVVEKHEQGYKVKLYKRNDKALKAK